jgi:hypothetical protein
MAFFYSLDTEQNKQTSLATRDRQDAQRLVHAKNEACRQPAINLQIARTYLMASNPQIATRQWQFVMDETAKLKQGPTKERWGRAMKDRAFDTIRKLPVLETRPEHFTRVLRHGTTRPRGYCASVARCGARSRWRVLFRRGQCRSRSRCARCCAGVNSRRAWFAASIIPVTPSCAALVGGVIMRHWRRQQRRHSLGTVPGAAGVMLAAPFLCPVQSSARQTYGSPRIVDALCKQGCRHGRNRIARLMKAGKLCGRQPSRYAYSM